MAIDELDRRIIDELKLDGRISYQDMGERIGLSPTAVKRRMDRMTSAGVIRGYTVLVDPTVDGRDTEAFVEVFCRGTVGPDELRRILGGIPDVIEAQTVTGEADALVRLRASSMPALEDALEKVRLAPQVDSTRSAIVLSQLIARRE
ncbi:Lrp/AsnC family transcriptional regulator [Demequina zhanjiangensis]|uniref:Lrp/AsnC family transcriptional regulator n=1 Tax=Demequina zhanjiangensis TaxID=3051659 RepID=A0ABT8G4Y0_9MICO|nr:Lrp/AsnC family transcriptional regulator [Demequina sp. SYSU T00b26]MDN4474195.1 Lrp/AsnC family transcriptional regulator [Demequina sp. SYSU T00b26]